LAYGHKETYTAGGGTFPDEVIREAGGVNIAENIGSDWAPMSHESILKLDPEIILITGEVSGGIVAPADYTLVEDYRNDPAWQNVRAVQYGQIYVLDKDCFNIPGPRLTSALVSLAQVFHPNLGIVVSERAEVESGS
ncbi:MAG: ABC transporter substrate-binding protein, partial [Verrucomicrobiota bacterium]